MTPMRKKFKIFYPKDHPDPKKAGTKYKPPVGRVVVMSSSGLFFLYTEATWETGWASISPLHEVIGNYDVVWND